MKYQNSETVSLDRAGGGRGADFVLPQALGGGRGGRGSRGADASLLIDYKLMHRGRSGGRAHFASTLYQVDFHPRDGNTFIVSSALGDVRKYDMRMTSQDPMGYTAIFVADEHIASRCEVTGCRFSKDGSEIVATYLNNHIYVFDANHSSIPPVVLSTEGLDAESADNPAQEVRIPPSLATPEQPASPASPQQPLDDGSPEARIVAMINLLAGRELARVRSDGTAIEIGGPDDVDPSGDENSEPPNGQSNDGMEVVNHEGETKDNANTANDTEKEPQVTYKGRYTGHISSDTIKSCNFLGPNSEYVMTGSDNARIFIWNKATAEIVTVLEGHQSVVNCVISHPYEPMIASSGIDDVVKLWEPREMPTPTQLAARISRAKRTMGSDDDEDDTDTHFNRLPPGIPSCVSQ